MTQQATRFIELMRAGTVAYAEGNRERAHRLWRRAAAIDPRNEQVWLALLNVLESEDDRRVCLQNIVAINPNNVQAQEKLERHYSRVSYKPELHRAKATRPLWRVLLWWLEGIALGVLLALAISLLRYGL